jgi:uncharacterized membrane protein YgdD (TMEM256/DUF423 family)
LEQVPLSQGALRYPWDYAAISQTGYGDPMQRLWITLASLAGVTAVAMAAYAAHGIADPTALRIVNSGIQMQGWHALALFGTGLWTPRGGPLAQAAGAAFTIGLILFCGAVYSLGLAGISWGILAPTGGTLLMIGWLLLGASALRAR